jgi:hypothetical protein
MAGPLATVSSADPDVPEAENLPVVNDESEGLPDAVQISPAPESADSLSDELPRQVLEVESPPEYQMGAIPASDQDAVRLQTEARSALGLPIGRELVARLVSTPNSMQQIRTYGTVLTPEEQSKFDTIRKQDAQLDVLLADISSKDYYAGGSLSWSKEDGLTRSGLTLWVTEPGRDSAELAVREHPIIDLRVEVVVVDHSWAELEALSSEIRQASQTREIGALPADLPESLLDALSVGRIHSAGYSIARNAVVVQSLDYEILRDRALDDRAADVLIFEPPNVVKGEAAPCEAKGCPPLRAGVEIDYSNSNNSCSLGLPVVNGATKSYLTAGHCRGSANFDAQLRSWDSLTRNVDAHVGNAGGTWGWYTLSRFDGRRLNTQDHLVTNRMRVLGNNGYRIFYTQNRNSVLLNSEVCRTGKTTSPSCGQVTDIGTAQTLDGVLFVDQVLAGYVSAPGDSGGPVHMKFQPEKVAGMHSSTCNGACPVGQKLFSSVEHLGDVQAGMQIFNVNDSRRDWILGLYMTAFGRFPAQASFDYWRWTINGGSCDISDARDTLWAFYLTSPEFQSVNPATSDYQKKQQIRLLYWGALGRDATSTEQSSWLATYNTLGWDDIVWSVIFGSEFSLRYWLGGSAYDGQICS